MIKMKIARGIYFPDFMIDYRTIVIKAIWYGNKNRHVDQWNKIEDPNISTHYYSHLILDKKPKKGENGAGKTGCPQVEIWNETPIYHHEQKLDPSVSTTSI